MLWIEGLPSAAIEELLRTEDGSTALVFHLARERIGAILLEETPGLRAGAASANAANESWAGLYVTDLPNGFKTDGATPLPNLVLGR